jgi:hypothetical protein
MAAPTYTPVLDMFNKPAAVYFEQSQIRRYDGVRGIPYMQVVFFTAIVYEAWRAHCGNT